MGGSGGVEGDGGGDGDGGGGEGEGGGGDGKADEPQEGIALEVTLEASPAMEMSLVYKGPAPPLTQTQHGSPSSRPLV